VPGSPRYVQLAGLAALLTGALLLLARVARLGFLANFLSRTVLVGFLAGVGIQVAVSQLPDMLGVRHQGTRTIGILIHTVAELPHAHPATVVVSGAAIVIMLAARRIAPRVPGALIAVVGTIIVSRFADLAARGVATVGAVPRGFPQLGLPDVGLHDARLLLGVAASMFVVILAQSAATSRAYAAKYTEDFSEDIDLVGLGAANLAAAFSGTFVVNGSPTKTQMVDGAGGRSQLAQLFTSAVVVIVLLIATGPLAYLPTAALAAVVFLIAIELIDLPDLRHIFTVRKTEFAVALLTTAAVVALGVEDGIVLAVIASVIDHLRHSYRPLSSVLVKSPSGHWQPCAVEPGARTEDGLVVYRFGTSLYYANAGRLIEDVTALVTHGRPLRWLVLDGAAIGDVDFTSALVLAQVAARLHERKIRFAVTSMLVQVRKQLDGYGIKGASGPDVYYDTPGQALNAFHAAERATGPGRRYAGPPPAPNLNGPDSDAT
jgi:sulfate permease, SulP family